MNPWNGLGVLGLLSGWNGLGWNGLGWNGGWNGWNGLAAPGVGYGAPAYGAPVY